MSVKIAPSILSADFANLERDIHDIAGQKLLRPLPPPTTSTLT